MDKKKYESAEIEVVKYDKTDVMTQTAPQPTREPDEGSIN